MIKDTDREYKSIFKGAVVIAAVLVTLCLCCSSCSFFRKVSRTSDVKTETAKVDTGSVRKNEVNSKKDSEYEKTTYIPVFNKDTTVNNFYLPESKAQQPYIIIQEKGRSSEQVQTNNTDSIWGKRMEQIITALTAEKTKTEGSVLGMGFWIGIAAVGVVLIILLLALVYFKNQIVNIKTLITPKIKTNE